MIRKQHTRRSKSNVFLDKSNEGEIKKMRKYESTEDNSIQNSNLLANYLNPKSLLVSKKEKLTLNGLAKRDNNLHLLVREQKVALDSRLKIKQSST